MQKRYLICVAQKYTKHALAMDIITFEEGEYETVSAFCAKAQEATGILVDGETTYIEWIRV